MLNINLLPWRAKAREAIRQQFLVLSISVAVLAVVCLCVADLFLISGEDVMQRENLFLTQQIKTLSPATMVAKNFLTHQEVVRKTISLANQLERGRDVPIRVLEILETLPKTMELRQITYSKTDLMVSVVANITDGHEMRHLIDKLRATGLFQEVKVMDFQPLSIAENFSESFKVTAVFQS